MKWKLFWDFVGAILVLSNIIVPMNIIIANDSIVKIIRGAIDRYTKFKVQKSCLDPLSK
ncbi:MAG: hypothetical protein HN704_00875 [Bacteroidetes bacterium]|jgi:hypothetical protein|nr:hypothetical protein [Bacteroidota bacterium]MBT6687402.1 hypothetical protein [Bacteroidota bacterium]MBT7142594.1 hypothetical protein [Bacteroidota bacterium]MBT7490137.1 hypothetical protein [Bacteroidota bacterium]